MANAPTIYQKKQAARRAGADIERLAKTYKTSILDVAQQQQTAFTGWQEKTKNTMAPYEAAVRQYTDVDFPAYQSKIADYETAMDAYNAQANAYRQRLDEFNRNLLAYEADPVVRIASQKFIGGRGRLINIEGRQYSLNSPKSIPGEISLEEEGNEIVAYRDKPIPTFTEQAPAGPSITLPDAPPPPGSPPKIEALDTSEFAQKRAEIGSTFKRELGERKAAKMNVAMRRSSRGMLQGV